VTLLHLITLAVLGFASTSLDNLAVLRRQGR